MLESLRHLSFTTPFARAARGAAKTPQGNAPAAGAPTPAPEVQAPAPAHGGAPAGELRLRVPKVFVLSDVPLPLTYH